MSESNKSSTTLSRLELLKAKRLEAKKLNQEYLKDEANKSRLASIAARKHQHDTLNDDSEFQVDTKKGSNNLDYTIEETEKWNSKQHKSLQNYNKDGSLNQDKLAESTYYKELHGFKIDKKAYQEQKLELMSKYNVDESQLKKIVDLSNNPSQQTKEEMSKLIAQFKENKTNKRRRSKDDESHSSGYINEKNRQFNMKLNRQYSS